MDRELRKWVLLGYVIAAALASYVLYQLAYRVVATYDIEARIKDIDLYMTIGAAVIGAIIFAVFNTNTKINEFCNEVVTELSRVTWPTVPETNKNTVVVMIMVVISGGFLGLLDYFWVKVLQLIL